VNVAVIVLSVLYVFSEVSSQELADCSDRQLELVFLQDASYSVSKSSFEEEKHFVTGILHRLPLGPENVRVALVRFGTKADVIFKLSDTDDVSVLTDVVEGMKYITGETNTGLALRIIHQNVLKKSERRPDVNSAVIIITDGVSSQRTKTKFEAKRLRRMGVRLVWIYITGDGDNRLMGIEREEMIYRGDVTLGVANFTDLTQDWLAQHVLNATCQEFPVDSQDQDYDEEYDAEDEEEDDDNTDDTSDETAEDDVDSASTPDKANPVPLQNKNTPKISMPNPGNTQILSRPSETKTDDNTDNGDDAESDEDSYHASGSADAFRASETSSEEANEADNWWKVNWVNITAVAIAVVFVAAMVSAVLKLVVLKRYNKEPIAKLEQP